MARLAAWTEALLQAAIQAVTKAVVDKTPKMQDNRQGSSDRSDHGAWHQAAGGLAGVRTMGQDRAVEGRSRWRDIDELKVQIRSPPRRKAKAYVVRGDAADEAREGTKCSDKSGGIDLRSC